MENVDISGDSSDGDLPESISVTVEIAGPPEGCALEQTRILPPVSVLNVNESEKRPTLFRVRIECHSPAIPGIVEMKVTVVAALASGELDINPDDNSVSVTKSLFLQQP